MPRQRERGRMRRRCRHGAACCGASCRGATVAAALPLLPREAVSMPWRGGGEVGRRKEEALPRRWPWHWRPLALLVVAVPVAALPIEALNVRR